MRKIVYLPLARADLLEAITYIGRQLDSPQAAKALYNAFLDAVERVAAFPYAYELYRTDRPMLDEIRKVPVKGYVLYYTVYEDRIELRRFLHDRRERKDMI